MPAEGKPPLRSRWKAVVPAPLRHGILIFLVVIVVEYLVVPELVGASKNIHYLERLNIGWLAAGVGFEAASLFAYALLTWTVLPHHRPSISRLFRIDLSTTAVAHTMPGGTAASAGLGYRLLTSNGVTGADAGFTMATQGIGSAVVLNVMLWLALVISIPIAGFHTIYIVVALLGMIALAFFAILILPPHPGRGTGDAPRAAGRRGAARASDPDRLEATFRHLGDALRTLATNSDRLRSALAWAAGNWLLDAAALWSFLAALGRYVNPIELFAAYGIANVLAAIPITPGGLGFVEASLPLLLASFGVTKNVALLGVLGWRIVNFWLPIPVGAGAYLSLKLHRGEGLRAEQARALADLAVRLPPPEPPAGGLTLSRARRRAGRRRGRHAPSPRRGRRTRPRRSARKASACAGPSTARARVRLSPWSTRLSRSASSWWIGPDRPHEPPVRGVEALGDPQDRSERRRPGSGRGLASWANGLNVAFGVPATW